MPKFILERLRNRRGQSLALVAVMMVVIIAAVGLAIDLGLGYLARTRLQNYCDASCLAGSGLAPTRGEMAAKAAEAYGRNIGASPYLRHDDGTTAIYDIGSDLVKVTVPFTSNTTTGYPAENCLRVDAYREIPALFMRILRINYLRVSASAVGTGLGGGPVSAIGGILPFGLVWNGFQPGQKIIIKEGAGSGYHGNYKALALGGNGARVYELNIKHGYDEPVRVGDWLTTEPGNMSGPTEDGVYYRINACHHQPPCTAAAFAMDCPRLIIIPVVESLEGNGRYEVMVVGFAAMFLEGVGGNGNDNWVEATLLKLRLFTGEGDLTAPDFGLSVPGRTSLLD